MNELVDGGLHYGMYLLSAIYILFLIYIMWYALKFNSYVLLISAICRLMWHIGYILNISYISYDVCACVT